MMLLKERLARGEQVVGTWLSVDSAAIGELLALAPFDFVAVDAEHGAIDLGAAENLVRAVSGSGKPALVRVAWNDQALIKRALDLGPAGVIIPMVSTPEAAQAAGRFAKYPPVGVRGVGVARAQKYGLDLAGYLNRANDEVLVVVQIEDRAAVDSAEDIARASGVDMVFIGPVDLSSSLGFPAQPNHPAVDEAISRVLAAARRAGKLAGIHAPDGETAARRFKQGFSLVTIGADLTLLAQGARAALGRLKPE